MKWDRWPLQELLDVRIKDLGLTLDGTWVESCIQQLYAELEKRDIALRPHCWLSDEWFSPTNVPGIGIPFYLVHPRLIRLERSMMLEAEGASRAECMRILRHEAGHAMQHGYRLHRRPSYQRLFGMSSTKYPTFYRPKPASRNYVQHLRAYYAQAHPEEDYAETFAVWLDPASNWSTRYAGWPAQRKVAYLDRLMRDIAGRRPAVSSRREVDPLPQLEKTLREHYLAKREHYGLDHPDFYESDLGHMFSSAPEYAQNPSAARFLRKIRREARATVASFTDSYQYTIEQLIEKIILRCRDLNLRLTESEDTTKTDFMVFLTVQTMNYLHSGRHRVAL